MEKKQGIMNLQDAINAIKESGITGITNRVINCDCLDLLKYIPDKSIDLCLTDPPYNAKNIGPNARAYDVGKMQLPETEYKKFCKNWFREVKRISKNILFTPGISNTHYYSQPTWQICWHKPAAVSFNRMGGFNAWEPIFFYGKMPKGKHIGQDYKLQNTLNLTPGIQNDHPCPKPLPLWKWLVENFSLEGDIVFDPMLGSGTTVVAAKHLKRNFIGIEISEKYCRIASDRLRQEILF